LPDIDFYREKVEIPYFPVKRWIAPLEVADGF